MSSKNSNALLVFTYMFILGRLAVLVSIIFLVSGLFTHSTDLRRALIALLVGLVVWVLPIWVYDLAAHLTHRGAPPNKRLELAPPVVVELHL